MFDYKEFCGFLKEHAEEPFRLFQKKLIPSAVPILGVRTPLLKTFAKNLDAEDFFRNYRAESLEEKWMYLHLTAKAALPFAQKREKIAEAWKEIDNWALCDSFVSAFRVPKREKEAYFGFALEACERPEEFVSRFGFVFLRRFYLDEAHIRTVLDQTVKKNGETRYYVNMARAWLLADSCVRFREQTLRTIERLDLPAANMARRKIRESLRCENA